MQPVLAVNALQHTTHYNTNLHTTTLLTSASTTATVGGRAFPAALRVRELCLQLQDARPLAADLVGQSGDLGTRVSGDEVRDVCFAKKISLSISFKQL